MGKFYPNLVEKEYVWQAKALQTPLMTQNKVHIEEVSATYDWVPNVSFPSDDINYNVIQITAFTSGRLIKVGKHNQFGATLSTSEIITQLGGTNILAPQEVAELKFTAPVIVGSNISVSVKSFSTSTSLDDIPERVDYNFQETIDEDGIVVLKIRNEGDVDYAIPFLEISIVELKK